MTYDVSIDIAAPPERVWAVMIDIERWHEWTASITSITRLDSGPFRVGSKARVRQPKLLPAVWQVIELDPGRSFSWITKAPGIWVIGRHSVEPVPGGARASLSLRFGGLVGGLVARLTDGINRRYVNLEAGGLKRRSEG